MNKMGFKTPTASSPSTEGQLSPLPDHLGPTTGLSLSRHQQGVMGKGVRWLGSSAWRSNLGVQTLIPPLPGYVTSGVLFVLTEPHFLLAEEIIRSSLTHGPLILIPPARSP